MNEENEQPELAPVPSAAITPAPENNNKPPLDPKQLRIEHVGKLLGTAYEGASMLKLTASESKKLREDFPDTDVEIRPHDGIIYISHMSLRERLWNVFGPCSVAEICRERFFRPETSEVAVDLVLLVRGVMVAEGIGTAKYFANNAKTSFGDAVESAWSDALRRCCKKIGVGTQVWRPAYIRGWMLEHAVEFQSKWLRKDDPRVLAKGKKEIGPTPRAKKPSEMEEPPEDWESYSDMREGT